MRRRPHHRRFILLVASLLACTTGVSSADNSTAPGQLAPTLASAPTISGTPIVGGTLTGTSGTWNGVSISFSYQWKRCDLSGAACVAVVDATTSTYKPVAADVGSTLRLGVTATNKNGSLTAVTAQTSVVAPAPAPPPPPPVNTSPPVIGGTAQAGQTLSASNGSWSGTPTSYAYRWKRCDSAGANCVDVSGATASSYVLASADVGATMRVAVTATNAAGGATATSAQTPMVAAAPVLSPPASTALPQISGTARAGQTLSVSNGSWSGSPSGYAYQWKRCDSAGANCAAVSGATASSYAVVAADVGATLRATVTATNGGGTGTATSAQTALVAAALAAPANTSLPAISGTVQATLTLSVSTGSWSGSPTSYAYQWKRCDGAGANCASISGATASTYALGASDVGSTVRAAVTATNGVGSSTATSAQTAAVAAAPAATVSVSSSIANGSTISGSKQWIATATGSGVARIDFLVDGTKRWTEQTAPYYYNGDPDGVLDTTTLANGTHTLAALAFSSAGGELGRSSATVTVSNAAPAPSPGTGSVWSRYGTANGWRLPFRSTTDQDFEIGQDIALGAKYVRVGPNDAIIQKLLANGITPVILFGGNPTYPWTTTPAQLASQVSPYASRWGTKILYECLNEVNLHGWTPDAYLPYLKAFHAAVKAASPSATVLMNGLWTGSGTQALVPWTERFVSLGGLAYTDLYNVHLYDDAAEHGSWSMWDMTFGSGGLGYYDTKNVRSLVDGWTKSHGRPLMPIVSTESGGPVPKYSEAKQATIVTNALRAADGVGTGYRKLAFTLIYNVLDDDVAGFGLLRPDRSQRPAWGAFRAVATS